MKKKQYKRLEKLLVHLVESTINNGAELHDIKKDQRSIQDAMSYSLGHFANAVVDHLGHLDSASQQTVSLLESDDPQNALDKMVGQLGTVGDRLVDLHRCTDAWGKVNEQSLTGLANETQRNLDSIRSYVYSIDSQMAPVSHAAAQWSRSQVRSGPGIEEFAAASNDLPEPKAPEGPDPTTADSWAGRLGEDLPSKKVAPLLDYYDGTDVEEPKTAGELIDQYEEHRDSIQKEAVGRFEDSVGRITPTTIRQGGEEPKARLLAGEKPLTNAEDVARQGDPNPPKPGETVARLQAGNNILAQENRNLLEQLDRQAATIRKWREKARTLEEKQINDAAHNNEKIRLIMHELTGNDRSNLTLPWAVRDCIMELQKQVAQEGEASSIYRSKMLENERQLKLAVGEAQALPVDASMDAFIKWVGNRGWKWIVGHRGTINARLDRLDRERAYNLGNNVAPANPNKIDLEA